MVFTRSMIAKQETNKNEELERIRTDYDSSDEFVVVVKVEIKMKKQRATENNIPLTVSQTGLKPQTFQSTSDYLQFLKGPSSHLETSVPVPVPLKKETFDVDIDFDDAHNQWITNKRRKNDGNYVYLCGAPLNNGRTCRRDSIDKIGLYSGCKLHPSWEEVEHKFPGLATF
jgi:hypothetical protein